MKLIIDIPEEIYQEAIKSGYSYMYDEVVANAIAEGTPFDDVKAEITNLDRHKEKYSCVFNRPDLIDLVVDDVLKILDNIGKAEKEGGRT